MPAIETSGLSKVYRTLWPRRQVRAVDGLSLSVERGALFGLLGPNGAGKTTFIKLLLGCVRPSAGSARLFGRDAGRPEARRPVGYLPENHRFPAHLTGAGALDFYAALSGMETGVRRRRIPELLETVGLTRWAGMRLGKYSKGMQQRLGLAQALMHSPDLLILDEPTDGVDPLGRKQIREVLGQLQERGLTVFINSHLLAEVELFCREVAILDRGRVVLSGQVRDLTAGKGYRLTAAGVPEALRTGLQAKARSAAERDGLLELQFSERSGLNQAIDLLRAAHCEIESVIPTSSSLEEVFLRTVHAQ